MASGNLKTLVIGASPNPERYSNKAVRMLKEYGHDVVALARREGEIDGVPIQTAFPDQDSIHTVSLYISEQHQEPYFDLIEKLNPARVIFNPGTENTLFRDKLSSKGI